jgi:alkyl hydroperoxide reductase subunit F
MLNINLTQKTNQLKAEKLYDLMIVGSGPAGLSAAIYAARKGLSVGIIGDKPGGQVNDTSSVENYIGFEYVTGEALANTFSKHAMSLNIEVETGARVKAIEKKEHFNIKANNYMTYQSKTILVATGSKSRQLGVKGEKEFFGRGVSYCAICDGPLFKDKTVAVVGGGNSAVEAAIDLSKIAKEVYLIHRSEFRADQILINKLESISNVKVHLGTKVESIDGHDLVESIQVTGDYQGRIDTDGLLIEIGYDPNSDFIGVNKNPKGEILIDSNHKTSIDGIYAAGDVTTEQYKQIIVAASEGAKAALSINDYLNTL